MDKTETECSTPGGNPVQLANPPSSEAGLTDSGGDQLLLEHGEYTPKSRTLTGDINYYQMWREEVEARTSLQKIVSDLQKQVKELQGNKSNLLEHPEVMESNFHSDEEEIARETDWILKENKRASKKRKAISSPVLSTGTDKEKSKEKRYNENITHDANVTKIGSKGKQITPPPIMVTGVKTFNELEAIAQRTVNEKCTFTSYNNNVWKLNVNNIDAYRALTKALDDHKIQWHSYEYKAERPIKVMARGLHPSCKEEDIIKNLQEKGLKILEATNIIKKEKDENEKGETIISRRALPMYMLTFHHRENIQNIYKIKDIMNIVVKIEPMRKTSSLIPQCKRCQAFGHTQKYCRRDFVCVKCSGNHATNICPFGKNLKAKCANCKGDHPASYRGCIIAKEYQKRKDNYSKNRKSNQESTVINKNLQKNGKRAGGENTSRTYAQATANKKKNTDKAINNNSDNNINNKERTDSVNQTLSLILQQLEKQGEAISKLQNDVADIINNRKEYKTNAVKTNPWRH